MRYFEVASRLIVQEPNKSFQGYGLGQRHIQILLQFSMAAIYVAMNMALPIAIIPMTHPKSSEDIGVTSFPNWTDQSLILVATQTGYAVTQLFGSCISEYYGYTFVMPFSMFLCSIFCFLTPLLTENFGSQGLILCLMIQGAGQGFSLPVIPDYLNRWVPISEINSIGSFMFAANVLSAALSTKITAFISTSFLGWTFSYYIFGIMGFVWSYMMMNFGKNAPESSNTISTEERDFILAEKTTNKKMCSCSREEVAWKKLLNCPALLAIWAAHAGTFWALWLMTAEIPSYLFNVLNFDVDQDGDIVGDAYFMSWLFSFVMSGVTSYLIGSKILSSNFTRKVAQSIASYLAAACLITLGFLSDRRWVVFFINVTFSALTASFWGFMLNYNDIVRERSMITHIGGFIGTVTTLVPALLKQFIVTDQKNGFQWSIMFWLTAGVVVLSNTAFFFYSSGELQKWESNGDVEEQGECSTHGGEAKYLMQAPTETIKTYGNTSSQEPTKTETHDKVPEEKVHTEKVGTESETE
ncbi:putative inorganic phosphate cotransporter isoform X2 [Harmonia axyridis]|uniref:putative inorganic phosphate cotransporter isoform X2 n=1 Tax=Harmonia axyridis TaxID=115357 RepID=UPI001E2762DF|nr:putative inorganic phosphate cotransporter isoform X2 [Harmonia axyridis]